MPNDWSRFGTVPVDRVSDMPITRCFQIECPDHGIVDEPKTYAAAVKARREHYDRFHTTETEE